MRKDLAIFVTGLWMFSGTGLALDGPNPDEVYIKRVTYAGPGCPSGSVAHNLSIDAKAFTLLFDSMIAEAAPDLPGGLKTNSCRITIDLRFPQGWSYALFDVDYRGFVGLDDMVDAVQTSTYWYQANPGDKQSFSSTFYGPTSEDYAVGDTLGLSEVVYAPCGKHRALNIDTEIEVNNDLNPEGTGVITLDSVDGELTQVYAIKWMPCI